MQKSIENKFDTYRTQGLQEKLFVHTDKKNYLAGEICWFKLYNTDAYFHHPINFSKVAYVEILDKNNQPVLQAKIPLDKGTGNGSFYLPASLTSGNYVLRAYTNWMKNEGAEYFFEKRLSIVNPEKKSGENILPTKPAYEIAFFPEGGSMLTGIETRVGFKVNDQFGTGVYFEGWLVNDRNDTITAFHPLKFGMGSFSFTPVEGATYRALIKLSSGEQLQKELPAVDRSGYAMHLEYTGEGQIKITVLTKDQTSGGSPLFLFVHTRNVIKAAITNSIQNGKATFLLDTAKTGDGISHFTVFTKKGQPVCERLYFKKPAQALKITAVTDQPSYTTRKKITVTVNSSTEQGKAIPANMSMAVYKVDPLNTIDGENISNYLLLTADLSGTVESPQYYFETNNDTANMAMDNLMLTQGWRRFNWQDILQDKKPVISFLPEVKGSIITGKVNTVRADLPVKNVMAYLSVPGNSTQFQNAAADEEGHIKFEMKDLYTNGEIIVQTNNESDSLYRIDIDPPFFSKYSAKKTPPYYFTKYQDELLETYLSAQVQNTFLYNKLNSSRAPSTDTTAFYSKPDAVYLLDNYVRFTTLEEVLSEYVPEVAVKRRNNNFILTVEETAQKSFFEQAPLVLLDAVPVFNFNKIMAFDVTKIKKLEVVAKKYFLAGNAYYGIINFTTYQGDLAGFEIDPGAVAIDYEGLQLKREFYSPLYNTQQELRSRLPDFRTLLYWCPDIITGIDGKKQYDFFSSDLGGKFVVVVQGLSDVGRTGATAVYFDVNKH